MREDRKDELKVRKYPGIDVIVKPLNFRCMDAQLMGIKTFEKNISKKSLLTWSPLPQCFLIPFLSIDISHT